MDNKNDNKNRWIALSLILAAVLCLLIGWYMSFYEKETGPFATGSILAAILLLPGFYLLGGGQTGFFGRQVFFKINLGEADAEGNRVPQILDGRSGTVDATVLGVSRSLRFGADTGMSYFLICRYTDPQTGETQDLTSGELDEYPGREVVGQTVHVRLNPRDPEGYEVDVEELLNRLYS